jgi:hypothetical protein
MTQLIALALIAAGSVPAFPEGVAEGATFEASPEVAADLRASGLARLAAAAPPAAAAPKGRTVKARVLVDGSYGKVNDVVQVPVVIAAANPELDATPAAVAYAESLATK